MPIFHILVLPTGTAGFVSKTKNILVTIWKIAQNIPLLALTDS